MRHKQTIQIDASHFFWLITYFLKFTAQLEMDLEHIKSVLSFDIISYLTYEGVSMCEELELINVNQYGMDNKSCLRRMHLVSVQNLYGACILILLISFDFLGCHFDQRVLTSFKCLQEV